MIHDRLLVWKLNKGSTRALRQAYEKYKNNLVTLAAALLYDKAAAEDAIHDVFVKLINANDGLKINGNLKGYLYTAVANNCRNKNKSGAIRKMADVDSSAQPVSNITTPEDMMIFGEQSQALLAAVNQLPYGQREVILLRIYSGLKFKTIAKTQNTTVNTVQGRYRCGLEKLKGLLNGQLK